ncbi:MAG TPA: YeiH family protein [Steroidobacteraceae bacterium]|jgi:uncharacterized integral membrane protein (TIGR00698 family)
MLQLTDHRWECFINKIKQIAPGVALAGALALAAMQFAKVPWLQSNGISALTLAIVLGMLFGNTLYARIAGASAAGVTFSKQFLLRAGIILFGLRLTFQDIADVGLAGVAIDAVVLSTTFALSWWAGTRLFGLDRKTALLIGAGSSICGAAAVMATEPVVHGRAAQVTVAVSTVVVFGTVSIFLYPVLYHLNQHYQLLNMSPTGFGIYAGSTIHEVAQVLAAGRAVGEDVANTAVITKMVRVMMLAPFLILLSAYLSRNPNDGAVRTGAARAGAARAGAPPVSTAAKSRPIVIPWFALGFIAVAGFNSFALLPRPLVAQAINVDTFILAMAMAALGCSTHISAVRTAGVKPLALAALLFGWLILGGVAINTGVAALAKLLV